MAKKTTLDKKYIKLILILVGVVFITTIICNIYRNYSNNKINKGYITKYVSSIQYNEAKNTIMEFSGDTFLYVSYTGDQNIYNFEVKIKKILKDNELTDNFIYMDVTELIENDTYITDLNKSLELENQKINKLPAIIYYKDNKVIKVTDSQDHILNAGDFSQLLEKYEIVK